MGFLDRLAGGAPGGDEEAAQDIARLEAGGIPLAAERRIRELVGRPGAPFSSGFSPADLALSRLDAVRPVCQVMGSCVYKVGWQSFPWGSWSGSALATELRSLTDAWNAARRLALGRLEQEAAAAGCHAVVDVTFAENAHEFLSGEIEVVVQGTAVHLPEGGGDRPVLTDLSMPDYVLLRRAGYQPLGVVAASSVWYVVPSWRTQQLTTGWQTFQPNQELSDFTQGLYSARESALGRVTAAGRALGAGGLVGVTVRQEVGHREIDSNGRKRTDLVVTFHVLGTAIAPSGEHAALDVRTVVRQGAS